MFQPFLFLGLAIIAASTAQLCLKKGLPGLGELSFSFPKLLALIPRILQSGWLLGGLFLFVLGFFLWLFVLFRFQLNVAYPVAIGLQVVLIGLGSWIFFKEYLSFLQLVGMALLIVSVFLILKF